MPGLAPGMSLRTGPRAKTGGIDDVSSRNVTDTLRSEPSMTLALDFETCERARLARDPAYDGRFYVAVKTTKIYCRPVCPARPLSKNVRYYETACEAVTAGFRACKRCRPETLAQG
jgi:hypothetical protein